VQERHFDWCRATAVLIVGGLLILSAGACVAKDPGVAVRKPVLPAGQQYCGLDSLYACCRASGLSNVTLPDFEDGFQIGPEGIAASELIEIAAAKGIPLDPVSTNMQSLQSWARPAILHLNGSHYIAYLYTDGNRLVFYDNAFGLFDCDPAWFSEKYRWDGVALVVGGVPSLPLRMTSSPATIFILFLGCTVYGFWGVWPFRHRNRTTDLSQTK
jgi:ABC-type bacteriocin/lantibiotic exporter with double-glycine peptidase domain